MVARVAFKDSPKSYDYYTDLPLRTGDLVVVPAGDWFAVVRVRRMLEDSEKAARWVIQRLDLKAFEDREQAMEMFA